MDGCCLDSLMFMFDCILLIVVVEVEVILTTFSCIIIYICLQDHHLFMVSEEQPVFSFVTMHFSLLIREDSNSTYPEIYCFYWTGRRWKIGQRLQHVDNTNLPVSSNLWSTSKWYRDTEHLGQEDFVLCVWMSLQVLKVKWVDQNVKREKGLTSVYSWQLCECPC